MHVVITDSATMIEGIYVLGFKIWNAWIMKQNCAIRNEITCAVV